MSTFSQQSDGKDACLRFRAVGISAQKSDPFFLMSSPELRPFPILAKKAKLSIWEKSRILTGEAEFADSTLVSGEAGRSRVGPALQ
jgi:hypothetical protein